jgi:hypothetical protein
MAMLPDNKREMEIFRVIHPLDDQPEAKRNGEGLEPLRITAGVRVSLMVLRGYLAVMTLMLAWHALHLAGIFSR